MAYDLVVKNGRVIDGSGIPAFQGDVAVKDGRIVDVGRVTDEAKRTLNADGLVVAPGIIDNHTHYDAQGRGTRSVPSPAITARRRS
jgi:N-acyl-D-amino-acid deacylase